MIRIICRMALLLVLSGWLAGCGPASEPDAADRAVFRYSTDGVPVSLDPVQASSAYSNLIVVNLFDTLYRYRYLARPYQLAPNLATGWPEVSDDGLRYTFRIRPGARFADNPAFTDGRGRAVTVADLVYSIQRHFDPEVRSQGAWLWADRIVGLDAWGRAGADYDRPVEGLQIVDEHTLVVHLTRPYPQLVHTLATGFSALVPREAVEAYGREFGLRPVGSGPFRLLRFDRTRAVLERNPGFRRPPLDLAAEGFDPGRHSGLGLELLDGRQYPFIDRLEIHFIEENSARWHSYLGGAIDFVTVPSTHVDELLASRNPLRFKPEVLGRQHAAVAPEAGFVFLGFDMSDPRIGSHPDPDRDAANRALRCAIRDAFDWAARNRAFYSGIGQVFNGVIPPVVPEYDPDAPLPSPGGLARGRQRLEEAGWSVGMLPELRYGMVAGVQQRQMYELLRSELLALGFRDDQLAVDSFASFGEYSRAIKQRRIDLFFMGWTLDYPDAQNTLQLFYGPHSSPGPNNFNYRNPEFDALYERSAVMPPGPERTAVYQRMNEIVAADCVAISGLSRTRVHLWRKAFRMLPDTETLGGFFLRFVAPVD